MIHFFGQIGRVSGEFTLISRISIFLRFKKYVNQYIVNLAMLFVHLHSNRYLSPKMVMFIGNLRANIHMRYILCAQESS